MVVPLKVQGRVGLEALRSHGPLSGVTVMWGYLFICFELGLQVAQD